MGTTCPPMYCSRKMPCNGEWAVIIIIIIIIIIIYLLHLVCHPVEVVILHIYKL